VAARVNERMTVTLESRFRDKSNLNRERLRRFVPMVEELAREEPELLAMLIDDLYHATLHGAPEGSRPPEATRTAEQEAAPSGERTGRGRKGRRRGRRSDSDHSAD
jgi:ATP-dependent RNA helicase DeaD